MNYIKKVLFLALLLGMSITIAACSSDKEAATENDPVNEINEEELNKEQEQEKTDEPIDTENSEETDEEAVELPNVMDDIIGWEIDSFNSIWGEPTSEVNIQSGIGYQYSHIPGLTVGVDEYNYITSVIIDSENLDIFNTRVGQTPSEIKQIMDEQAIMLLAEGEDELDGGWFIQGQVDADKVAWYTSLAEDQPVDSIMLTFIPTEYNDDPASQDGEPLHVAAVITDIYVDLVRQTVVEVQITNLEPNFITSGSVEIEIQGTYGDGTLVTGYRETVDFSNVESGGTRQYNITNLFDYVEGIEIISATGY